MITAGQKNLPMGKVVQHAFLSNTRADAAMKLAAKVTALGSPWAYSEPTRAVQAVETHMSWVFLTDVHAYKLKKPVRYTFLDFRSLSARRHYCETEVRLNRRLAGDVYLGIVPLVCGPQGSLRAGGRGRIVDWLVKMRRLPADKALSRVISSETIDRSALIRATSLLANFYLRARPVWIAPSTYRRRLERELCRNFRELRRPRYRQSVRRLARLESALTGFLDRSRELIERRAGEGRIVEGHGDLRPDHVFLLKSKPVVIDCLEFNKAFRIVDPVDELAYLAMECERLGNAGAGNKFIEAYWRATGDRPPPSLVAFYRAYRACLRAKLAAWHSNEPNAASPAHWLRLARTYLRLAERYIAELR